MTGQYYNKCHKKVHPVTKQNFVDLSTASFEFKTFDRNRRVASLTMDIKSLLDNLHDEVSCSVCMCPFTEPKQLPCLHSFCLKCLNGIHRTNPSQDVISCPECRKEIRIPGSGNPSEFPSNFRINSLLDVLAIKECNTTGVKCGNCDKRSANCFYCFQCCFFWCEDCITGHNIIRGNKEHRVLAIKDFQDPDIEDVLKRPAFCQNKRHENKALNFFCKDCKVAICNSCVVTLHDGHAKVLLEDGANEHRLRMESLIKSLNEKAEEKRNAITELNQSSIDVQVQAADVKSKVQTTADQMMAIIEVRKQDIFGAVDNQEKESLECFALRKGEAENELHIIESAIEETQKLLRRSSSYEILGFNETFDTILQEQGAQGKSDVDHIPRFSQFTENSKLVNMLNTEGIGSLKTVFNTITTQQSGAKGKQNSKAITGFEEKHVWGSSFEVQIQTMGFRPVLSFGEYGESVGQLNRPCGVAVNNRNEIAVTEFRNHRVSVFSSDGTHLRSFGRQGRNPGEFNCPSGIAFDSNGNIIVADRGNNRVQVFSGNGKFLAKFGELGILGRHLQNPEGLSISSNGDIIVVAKANKLIKIFSPGGQFKRKLGGQGSLSLPLHCIQTEQYFIVSDEGEHCIKVFDLEGSFVFKFGKKGNKEGEFNRPGYLSVNRDGHLMVCDLRNNRVQLFELSGNFVTKFGTCGRGEGEFMYPVSTANLSDARIVVCDGDNNGIQIYKLI